jgi:23S rRNA (pseudouridine1915-N3)-methyltransferase
VKIVVLTVGRPDRTRFGELCDDYAARIRRFGVDLEDACVAEVRAGGRYTVEHALEREAKGLRGAVPARSKLVALDRSGARLSSEAFARRLEAWSTPAVTFAVGGPSGLDPDFVSSATAAVSLSAMTLPHDVARLVLLEQIFRALTILRGVPYHK